MVENIKAHNEIATLADFIVKLDLNKIPKKVIEGAKLCIIDLLGVGIGASNQPLLKNIRNSYKRVYGSNKYTASVLGTQTKFDYITASYLSAMECHRLELDDVHTRSKAHIGAVVVPTAWKIASAYHLSGKQLLEAVICGYEVESRIAMGFGVVSHRNKGWHVTGTAGTFGAATVASKLLGLSKTQTVSALGMAGTQSAGLWAFLEDGASNKILHPAHAAQAGINAAILAKSGMTGPEHILSAKDGGLYPAMSDDYHYDLVTKDLGKKYEILNIDRKPYPCCRSAHGAINGAIVLNNKYNIDYHTVKNIKIKTYEVGYNQIGKSESSKNPHYPHEAKFSTPYTVAYALINNNLTQKAFDQKEIEKPEIRKLMKKIKVFPDDEFTSQYPNHWGTEIFIQTTSNNYKIKLMDAYGSVNNPMASKDILKRTLNFAKGDPEFNQIGLIKKLDSLENWKEIINF